MSRYKNVNGTRIQFSKAEETARDLEEAFVAAKKDADAVAMETDDLTQAEFYGMMAREEFDDIWRDLRAALKGKGSDAARAARDALEANKHKPRYRLAATLESVALFREAAKNLNLEYEAKLTEDSITAAWRGAVSRRNI